MRISGTIILATVSLSACASFTADELRSTPSNVGVEQALSQVGAGFAGMRDALEGNKLGIQTCKVTVSLNVTASADEEGSLVVDFSAKPPASVATVLDASATAKGELSAESKASRGNNVVVELYHPACLPPNTLGYEKPEQLAAVQKSMFENGTSFSRGPGE